MYVGPHIVTRGLLVDLDASAPRSAPNQSSGWDNLVDGGGVKTNSSFGSPTLATLGGVRTWRFTTTSQYFESNLLGANNQPYLDATVEAWIYPEDEVSSGDRGTITRINGNQSLYMSWNKSSRKLSTYWYSHANNGYHETGAAMDRDQWHHICSVHRYDEDLCDQYTNGTKTTASPTQADSTVYGAESTGQAVEIGMEGTSRQFAGGICILRIYNVALTDKEVLNNYNAMKHRFI
jgi:hypothetical protein